MVPGTWDGGPFPVSSFLSPVCSSSMSASIARVRIRGFSLCISILFSSFSPLLVLSFSSPLLALVRSLSFNLLYMIVILLHSFVSLVYSAVSTLNNIFT